MASTTKIMTLILALEYGQDDDILTVSSYASKMPDVQLGIIEGEQYRLKDLFYSLMLESHNDVAVAIAEHIGGDVDTFDQAIRMLKPGGRIGNVNYLGVGDYVKIPRVEWGAGMGHTTIVGGLMPGGRLRSEKLARLITSGRIHPEKMITHVFHGWDGVKEALMLMKDKPADLIKPLVIFDK